MSEKRTDKLPVLYVKGTYYEVGYQIGWNFKNIIQDFVAGFSHLKTLLPIYETAIGKKEYLETLQSCLKVFPQYVEELRGISDGSEVPFYKLFLIQSDGILIHNEFHEQASETELSGCSSILVNIPEDNLYLGHNEDALPETLNHSYIVHVHIIDDKISEKWQKTEEKFVAYCYAGDLPGYCMGYNYHGLIHSINALWPRPTIASKIPCRFFCRAILGAKSPEEVINMLKGCDVGCGEGFGVNLVYANNSKNISMYNIEVAPNIEKPESKLSIYEIPQNHYNLHCNRYQRIKVNQMPTTSSDKREALFPNLLPPTTREQLLDILGDESDPKFKFFRSGNYGDADPIKTIAVGIFDFNCRTWSVYTQNPKARNDPLAIFSLDFRKQ